MGYTSKKLKDLQAKGDNSLNGYLNYSDTFLQIFEMLMNQKLNLPNTVGKDYNSYRQIVFQTRQLIQTYQQQN